MAAFEDSRGSGGRGAATHDGHHVSSISTTTSSVASTRLQSGSAILRLDIDADAAQKLSRQHAAGVHDDGVVLEAMKLTALLDGDFAWRNLFHVRAQHHAQRSRAFARVHALPIARLSALEGIAAVGENDLRVTQ